MNEEFYNAMVDHYGDRLANPEVFPQTFKYQVRMFLYMMEQSEQKAKENA
jgi:hypothetical protein